jgi:hypothetical protein
VTLTGQGSTKGLIAAVLLAVLALFTWVLHDRRDFSRDRRAVSGLQFAEIDRIVQNGISETELNKYSRRVQGTRVRWQGKIAGVDPDGTVYVAVNPARGAGPNTQFKLPGRLSQTLKKDQSISFVGTIQKVGILETFPPMPNTYVFLREVSLE